MRPRRISQSARRRLPLAALALITLVGAVVTAVATASTTTSNALPPAQVLNYQLYAGGKGKANPKLSPVTIGFINGQGGPPNFNFPQATHVIEAEVKMINAELGGVHGHPVRLNECFWAQAEEEGVRCGQQMVNSAGTKAIIFGFVTVGNQSIYSTVKGTKPIVGVVTANPADPTAKNTFFLNGSQTSVLPAEGEDCGNCLSDGSRCRHGCDRAEEWPAEGRGEGDRDRRPAALDRPARGGDAGKLVGHDHRGAWLHNLRAVRTCDRSDPLHEADPLDADLHLPSAGCLRERRHPKVDLRHRPDAGEPARSTVEAVSQERHSVRSDRE